MTDEQKRWIDNASYEQLLAHWRNAPAGDPMFIGNTGKYYANVMKGRREAIGNEGHVKTSKKIGWDKAQ